MVSYWFITHWKFDLPIEKVWAAVGDFSTYPKWFSYVRQVTRIRQGNDAGGAGSVLEIRVKTKLPFTLAFVVETVRREPPRLIEVRSRGDLAGMGRWELSEEQGVTTAVYRWNVQTTKRWMNLSAPLLRPAFAWNHKKMMDDAGRQLARYLAARVLVNESHEEKPANVA
ncbi:SRPBCC family protein [Arthrobacter sp. D3-16]